MKGFIYAYFAGACNVSPTSFLATNMRKWVYSKKSQGHAEESLISAVKDCGGPVKFRGFLSSEGPGNLAGILRAIEIDFRSKSVCLCLGV